jgi:hypothetical protein
MLQLATTTSQHIIPYIMSLKFIGFFQSIMLNIKILSYLSIYSSYPMMERVREKLAMNFKYILRLESYPIR